QRNWIGRSTGANIRFALPGDQIEVFTTRPDTLFGATFMVLAPEHPVLEGRIPDQWPDGTNEAWTGGSDTPQAAVERYRAQAAAKTEAERQDEGRAKTGVFTGIYATNPVTGRQIPIFIADYVLMGYGTGAIMAVPGGDERDHEFAQAYELPIVPTFAAPEGFDGGAWTGDGTVINSAGPGIDLNGMDVAGATQAITSWLVEHEAGEPAVTYRLRDWLFSRQRYWGEPFPVVYDDEGRVIDLPESALPVELPEVP